MNNAKTIEVVDPVFGLNEGDVLSRNSNEENFTLVDEHIGEGYSSYRSFSIPESMINPDNFKAIEEFIIPDEDLEYKEEEPKELSDEAKEGLYNVILLDRIDELQDEIDELKSQLSKTNTETDKFLAVIRANREKFFNRFKEAMADLDSCKYRDERDQWIEESMVVNKNLYTFADRLLSL